MAPVRQFILVYPTYLLDFNYWTSNIVLPIVRISEIYRTKMVNFYYFLRPSRIFCRCEYFLANFRGTHEFLANYRGTHDFWHPYGAVGVPDDAITVVG
jgi:hypothetical protein